MDAFTKDCRLMERLAPFGVTREDCRALRRIERTLHRWAEMECGIDGGCIERDERTGAPYWYNARARFVQANDPRAYTRIPDRERGALKRLAALVAQYPGLAAYHQTDPRGCALYVGKRDDMNAQDYTRGVAVQS